MIHIHPLAHAAAAASLVLLGSCTARLVTVREARDSMGTVVSITAAATRRQQAEAAIEAAFAEFQRLDGLLSHYSDSSEVGRLNREGLIEKPSADLAANVLKSLEYGRLSGGAFDITVQPILDLYDHTFRDENRPPTDQEIRETLKRVDYRRLRVTESAITLGPGQKITLGGIAKGYAVDRALEIMSSMGIRNALVAAGGDIRTIGQAEGRRDWIVALRNPRDEDQYITRMRASNLAVSTSGDYERYYEPDRRFHHIIDPQTGYSATELISVTVIADDAFDSDVLSTTAFVLGKERGMKLIESIKGAAGLLITRDRQILRTPNFGSYELP
jgi:thiamine biosynthesis lipoprotein